MAKYSNHIQIKSLKTFLTNTIHQQGLYFYLLKNFLGEWGRTFDSFCILRNLFLILWQKALKYEFFVTFDNLVLLKINMLLIVDLVLKFGTVVEMAVILFYTCVKDKAIKISYLAPMKYYIILWLKNSFLELPIQNSSGVLTDRVCTK